MSYGEQRSYPEIEPDIDMVCPNCKDPMAGAYVGDMETDYDISDSGLHRNDYVTLWVCAMCDFEFSEDEALSLDGVIEDEETDEITRIEYQKAKTYLMAFSDG